MEIKYGFSDVLIVPKKSSVNSRSEVNFISEYKTKHSKENISGCPVIVSNLDTTGTIDMAKSLSDFNIFVALDKHIIFSELKTFFKTDKSRHSFMTIGMDYDYYDCLQNLVDSTSLKYLMIDVANGYCDKFLNHVENIRNRFPNLVIAAGNVCTPEGVVDILNSGADIVKCGIGQGGLCKTSLKAGIGYPQFSVALECGLAATENGGMCISDGGIKNPSDICKSLCAGSHFAMSGSLFLGYEECHGEWQYGEISKERIKAYGMSSKTANDKYNGGLKNYKTSEGVEELWIDYKGPVSKLAKDIIGSITSCCSYLNCKNVHDLHKNSKFIVIKNT